MLNVLESTRNCRLCHQHEIVTKASKHTCPFEKCECDKCSTIRLQRHLMSEQMKLRRLGGMQMESSAPYANYLCQRCKNHGINAQRRVSIFLMMIASFKI